MGFASPHLLDAMASAGAYAGSHAPATVPASYPLRAIAEIRRARVEIYCGHRVKAISHIRAATKRLRVCAAPARGDVLATLDAAAWLTRAEQHQLAEQALDLALGYMAGAPKTI